MADLFGDIPSKGQPQGQQQPISNQSSTTAPAAANDLFGDIPTNQAQPSHLDQAVQSLQNLKNNPNDPGANFQALNSSSNSIAASTMAFIDTFNKQMGDLPHGIIQMLGGANFAMPGGKSINQQQAEAEAAAVQARQTHPIAAGLGDVTGFTGNAINTAALGSGLPSLGNTMLGKMGASAGQGALYGGTQYVDPGQSRVVNTGLGAAVGAAAPVVAGLGGAVINTLGKALTGSPAMLDPTAAAMTDTAQSLKNLGVTGNDLQAAIQPAQNVGTTLSLGEALRGLDQGGPAIATAESKLGTGTAQEIADATQHLRNTQTIGSQLGQKVLDTVNSIVPEGNPEEVKALVNSGYDSMKQYAIPDEQLQQLQQNDTFNNYLNSIKSPGSAPQEIQALPDNSVRKLEAVNQNMNDAMSNNASIITKNGVSQSLNNNQLQAIIEAKQQLQPILSQAMPDGQYKNILDLAGRNSERNTALQNIADVASGAGNLKPDGTAETPLEAIYNKLWKTPSQQQTYIDMIKNSGGSPEDIQTAKDVMYTVNHTINSPVTKILSGTRVAAETNAQNLEKQGLIRQAVKEVTSGDYNRALLQITLGNGDGHQALIKAMNAAPTLGDKIVGLADVLKSSLPQTIQNIPAAVTTAQVPSKAIIHNTGPLGQAVYSGISNLASSLPGNSSIDANSSPY